MQRSELELASETLNNCPCEPLAILSQAVEPRATARLTLMIMITERISLEQNKERCHFSTKDGRGWK